MSAGSVSDWNLWLKQALQSASSSCPNLSFLFYLTPEISSNTPSKKYFTDLQWVENFNFGHFGGKKEIEKEGNEEEEWESESWLGIWLQAFNAPKLINSNNSNNSKNKDVENKRENNLKKVKLANWQLAAAAGTPPLPGLFGLFGSFSQHIDIHIEVYLLSFLFLFLFFF